MVNLTTAPPELGTRASLEGWKLRLRAVGASRWQTSDVGLDLFSFKALFNSCCTATCLAHSPA